MRNITVETAAEGIKYTVTVQQFESREEIDAALGNDGVLANINSLQAQNGKQGDKGRVRDAIRTVIAEAAGQDVASDEFKPAALAPATVRKWKSEAGIDDASILADERVVQAIAEHRENAAGYVLGKARGSSGGPTQKTKQSLGDRIIAHQAEHGRPPSQKELAQIMQELGL